MKHEYFLCVVYTLDFSNLLRMICNKIGVETDLRIYHTIIAKAQKKEKISSIKGALKPAFTEPLRLLLS